ncbi:Ger(x)C family spore germination protein [Priestia megaterium]|uniref:Ger(x)C family spore germination protein n=1 Tax=Priestia megaterium TaxID=1404 RepID=UPI002D80C305|nr:Ger(x)C family spore germination protein [Priestia megaterium]MEB4887671.1 Ger(x)C family spore germination protein [Priestia megaterium]
MKQIKIIILIGCFMFVLTGCWDEREIGEMNYAITLGIDYKDEYYLLYVQTLDFSGVAKQETGKLAEPSPLYIGKGKGRNINDAIYDLYRTSQQVINWAHVGAIVYSGSVLERGIDEVNQELEKNGQFRYTPWVFGTKDPIEEVLSIIGFFQMPPIYTIIYKPTETYNIYSFIRPLKMYHFSALLSEPGSTVLLPSLSIDDTKWIESKNKPTPKKTLKINGVFPISDKESKEWLPYDELSGIRWMEAKTKNTPIDLIKDGKIIGLVHVTKPSAKISVIRGKDDFQFKFHVKAKGALDSLEEHLSNDQIEIIVRKQIESEIKETYLNGLEKGIDVLNFRNKIFHKHVKPSQLNDIQLTADSLREVSVDFKLKNRGVYD